MFGMNYVHIYRIIKQYINKMKTIFKTLIVILSLIVIIPTTISAQNFDEIATAIRTGNSSAIAKYFEGNVEINVKDAQNSYSKSQAEVVLKNFFGSHTPKAFNIAHQGTSPEGSKYFIGNLSTNAGTFRTFVYAKQNNGNFSIQEIRFEEQ
jgi:hypothetical protein